MTNARCIWCLGAAEGGHEEHIIPEAIGCPEGFVLSGSVVCQSCNNGLAHLDQAVADDFDFHAFMAGVPRKGGRPPAIKSRGNVVASIESVGPTYTFNMERHPVTAHDASRLASYRGSRRDVRASLSKDGELGTITFQLSFGNNPKFIRGLTKIALSSLTYFLGPSLARTPRFNAVRDFVVIGKGDRHVLIKEAGDAEFRNIAWAPYVSASGDYVATFRIARVEFVVDLSESESTLSDLVAKAHEQYGKTGWCILPPRG